MTPYEFAAKAHAEQRYGQFPYIVHLGNVGEVLIRFGFLNESLIAAAWLHDVVEDTSVKLEEISAKFGPKVAEIVAAVTSEPGKNRKERNSKTYPKIAANPQATILKLADRIANVEFSIKTKSDLFEMYKKEHAEFAKALPHTEENKALWTYLEKLNNTGKVFHR